MTPLSAPPRVVTLSLHPAIDRVVEVDALVPGDTFDGRMTLSVPSGKGVNTARSLRAAAGESFDVVAAAWVGQGEAAWFVERLEAEDVAAALCPRGCPTRIATTYLEASGRETHIKEAMRPPSREEESAFASWWEATLKAGDWVALCGSAPPGTSADLIRRIVTIAREKSVAAIIADTNGMALEVAAAAGLDGVKGNAAEIGALLKFGGPVDLANETHRASLVDACTRPGAPKNFLMTMGSRGAALISQNGIVVQAPPPLPAGDAPRAATGCGDAATAGWLWGWIESRSPEEILKRAVACGTAKLYSADPGGLDGARVTAMLSSFPG